MIREFNKDEVLETFVEVVREKSPFFLVDQAAGAELSIAQHVIIKETIERVIKKASPNLSVLVQVNPIQAEMYGYTNKFEPFFGTDPSDVNFYITREAVPASYRFNNEEVLTCTNIGIDYYYPASWAITPPRDKKAVIRRTMDEILFTWTRVSKTLLSAPIVRFEDEEEAGEAIFAFANTLLFNSVVADGPYHRRDFTKRLMDIQKAIRGNQPNRGRELATIVWPKDYKISPLDVPVVNIQHNKITQFMETYVACYGHERAQEYRTVLKAFTFYGLGDGTGLFSEEDIDYYLENNVGQPSDDYSDYNMRRVQRLVSNGDHRAARPPMIDTTFKGIGFINVCPFTYGSRGLTYIHFEKDIVSHLGKVLEYSDTECATDIAQRVKIPKGDEANKTYDIDPGLIGLFQLDAMDNAPDKEVYKNKGLYLAEEEAAKQDLEANAQKAVKENIRSMEFVEPGFAREYTAHWADVPF